MSESLKKQGCFVITSASAVESVRAGSVEGGPGNLSKLSVKNTPSLLTLKECTNKKRMFTKAHILFKGHNLYTWSNHAFHICVADISGQE